MKRLDRLTGLQYGAHTLHQSLRGCVLLWRAKLGSGQGGYTGVVLLQAIQTAEALVICTFGP